MHAYHSRVSYKVSMYEKNMGCIFFSRPFEHTLPHVIALTVTCINILTVDRSLSSSFGSRHRLPPPSTDRLQTADISSWYPSTCCHYLKSSMTRCSNGRIQSSIRLPLLQLTLNERSLSFIFSSVYSPLYYDSFSAHCYAQSQSRFETPRTSTLSFVVSRKRACHVRHKILFWYLFALSRGSDQFLKQLWQNTPLSEMFSQASTVILTKLI